MSVLQGRVVGNDRSSYELHEVGFHLLISLFFYSDIPAHDHRTNPTLKNISLLTICDVSIVSHPDMSLLRNHGLPTREGKKQSVRPAQCACTDPRLPDT